MRLTRTEDATVEPVTLEDVKEELILTGTADDGLINRFIKSGRQYVENFCKISIFTLTWEVTFSQQELCPPGNPPLTDMTADRITLPRSPIQSINSVTWTNEDATPAGATMITLIPPGTSTTLTETTDYRLEGDVLIFVSPKNYDAIGTYTVNYDAGFDDSDANLVPEDLLSAIRVMVSSNYENREQKTIPSGLRQLLAPYRRGRLL